MSRRSRCCSLLVPELVPEGDLELVTSPVVSLVRPPSATDQYSFGAALMTGYNESKSCTAMPTASRPWVSERDSALVSERTSARSPSRSLALITPKMPHMIGALIHGCRWSCPALFGLDSSAISLNCSYNDDVSSAGSVRVGTQGENRWRRAVPLVILATTWGVMLAYAYPGIMTVDSFDQLRQGRAGVYTDGHPPVMAALWGLVDRVVAGPAGFYLLQTATFVIGLYAVLRGTFAPVRAAVIAGLCALFPPILAPMGVVWKDALMASMLALGFAGLLATSRRLRLAGLAALFVASAIRYNAAAATLPIIVVLFMWSPAVSTWAGRAKRYALATAVWLAITAGSLALNIALTDRPMHFWHSSTAIMDIVGTLAHVEPDLADAELEPVLRGTQILVDRGLHAEIRARYSPHDFGPLVIGPRQLWTVPIMGDTPAPAPQRAAIGHAWWYLVSTYPGAYARHRLAVFGTVLGLAHKSPGVMVMTGRGQMKVFAVPMGLDVAPPMYQNWIQRRLERIARNSPLFRGWFYLVLALAMLALTRRHRDVFALLASGFALELSLLPLAVTADYRYSHWLALTTILAAVILVARRYRSGRQPA